MATFTCHIDLSRSQDGACTEQVQEAQCSHPRIVHVPPEPPMCVTREQTLAGAHSIDEAMAGFLARGLVGMDAA